MKVFHIKSDQLFFGLSMQFFLGVLIGLSLFPFNLNALPPVLDFIPDQTLLEDQSKSIQLSATDPDGDPLNFTAASAGKIGIGVSGTQLTLIPKPDWSGEETISVTVDDGNFEADTLLFQVYVQSVNDPPIGITLSNNSIKENEPLNTLVGNLAAIDADADDSHFFTLVSGDGDTDNASFRILNENQLFSDETFDFENIAQRSVRIEVMDHSGASYVEVLSISIVDVGENEIHVRSIPEQGGSITGGGFFKDGDIAEISAVAAPNYIFAGWSGELPTGINPEVNRLSFPVAGNATLYARFARTFYTVNVAESPALNGYVTGGGSILAGEEITLTAVELEGAARVPFSHWRVNGIHQYSQSERTLTITVDQDLDIEAIFDMGLPDQFVYIPGGSIVRAPGTKVEHVARVSPFYISKFETTKAQWYEVYNWALDHGYSFEFDPDTPIGRNRAHNDVTYLDDFPITGVSWNEMVKWCNAFSEMNQKHPVYFTDSAHQFPHKTADLQTQEESLQTSHVNWRGQGFRLPTELEWEYAARGGVDYLLYPSGNTIDETHAFFGQDTQIRSLTNSSTHNRTPNPYGLYDMAGNAWEACWDWAGPYWFSHPQSRQLDSSGPSLEQTGLSQNYRSVRGGSGNSTAKYLRVDNRSVLKSWYNYAITLRPVVAAPNAPNVSLSLLSPQAHLGSVLGAGTYEVDSTATIEAIPDHGAQFLHWLDMEGNLIGTNPILPVTMGQSKRIQAIFENVDGVEELHTVLTLANPSQKGRVVGKGAYLSGSLVQVMAIPILGEDFVAWNGALTGQKNPQILTVDKNLLIEAFFGDNSMDSDGDKLSDLYEQILETDPHNPDSDGDTLPDGLEINSYSSNPLKLDSDGDGFDDALEILHNRSPRDSSDVPFIPEKDLRRYFEFRGPAFDYDRSGNNGHASNHGAPLTYDRNKNSKRAYHFNGSCSFVEISGFRGVLGAEPRSFSGWFRLSGDDSGPLLSYGTQRNGFHVRINGSGVIEVSVDSAMLTGTTSLSDSIWHQFLVSFPEGGSPSDIKVYIDGKPETMTAAGQISQRVNTISLSSVLIGKSRIDDDYFLGDIDEVRFWDRRLIEMEAEELYYFEIPTPVEKSPPKILQQPIHTTVHLGGDAEFGVLVDAGPNPTYQWLQNVGRQWIEIPHETTPRLKILNVESADALKYAVRVTNSLGSTYSRYARLNVLEKPLLTQIPQDTAFLENKGGKIVANIQGSHPLTIEWFKDGVSLGKSRSNLWKIPKTANKEQHEGYYSFKVSNSIGEFTSPAFHVSIIQPVSIVQEPESVSAVKGQSVELSITAKGGGQLTYQWYQYDFELRKYIPLPASNHPTYRIESIGRQQDGRYLCVVTNGPSKSTSRKVIVRCLEIPTFTTDPQTIAVNQFEEATLRSFATGVSPPFYLWQKYNPETRNWDNLDRLRRSEIRFRQVAPEFAGKYRVIATNEAASVASAEAELIVYYSPVITDAPPSQVANEGSDVTLSVQAHALDRSGDGIAYQWYFDGVKVVDADGISGSATNTLHLQAVGLENQGKWYCVLANSLGASTSPATKLSIHLKPYAKTPLEDRTVNEGQDLEFYAAIIGGKPLNYQWYKDGVAIPGATLNKLFIPAVSVAASGLYTFEAMNLAGSVTLQSSVQVVTSATNAPLPNPTTEAALLPPYGDFDGDGIPNLIEEALGSDYKDPTSVFTPAIDIVEDGNGEQFLSFSYSLNTKPNGLITFLEQSVDLVTWEPIDLNEVITSSIDRGDVVHTTVYLPVRAGARFVRLRVEK